ncbi:MAG: translocation/assembly module TamB domain-containing protein, partial [Proteobacteria bacterium]|nr:translocation/assembly module TamB domain-containing protein [Pseudomonadota bacterium]
LRFALDRASSFTDGGFRYAGASGSLSRGLSVRGVRYRDDSGDDLRIDSVSLAFRPWALPFGRLHVTRARIDGVDLTLGTPSSQPGSAFSLQPPLTIALDDAQITRLHVKKDNAELFTADRLALAGLWSQRQLLLKHLSMQAPHGTVELQGAIALAPGYPGQGNARLDWTQDGRRYVAELETRSDGLLARLDAKVSSPLRATLQATLKLDANQQWTMALNAPRFDARALPVELPESFKALAVQLRGTGDARSGKLQGALGINDHTLLLDPAQFRLDGKTLTLDPLRLRSPQVAGVATATGTLRLDADPVSAALDLEWQDVLLPADLAGQPLATHGALHFGGSAQRYALNGALSIGPPDRLANLQLALQGTPQQVAVQTLKLVQKNGGLDAHGTIGLQPRLSWQLDANARKFDPGAFAAGWNGALDFTLATQGQLTPRGPDATLKLDHVAGTLRQRSVNGSQADLRITPDNLLDGTLLLAVGRSRIRAQGRGGARTDATIAIDIASLDDWLPHAAGALQGQFTARGAWPKLAVAGRLHGQALGYNEQRVASLQLDANIPDISQPGGDIDLALGGAHVQGLDFDTAHLDAHGNAASHRLQFEARGPQLAAALALQGSWNAKTKNWSGTLHDLRFTPQALPEWHQQQPANLSWRNGAASLSQLCLSAGEPSLCIAGDRKPDGSLSARYQLQRLPLQLLASLAAGSDPLQAGGELSGSGQLAMRADGGIQGNASLQAGAGSLAFASTPNAPLLAWTALQANANASGQSQRLDLRGDLADGGSLRGDVTLTGAQHALGGNVSADLRSLAFLQAFSSEIANVKGSLAGTLALGGTLAAPQFQGDLRTQGFSAELPRAGLKLHDGSFAIAGDAQGQLRIQGRIASGDGVLNIDGNTGMSAASPLSLAIRGDNVLVADIPAAHVIASPDLRIGRDKGVYALTGTLGIPRANIEIEKLPGQGPAQASPDVVVVDEEQPQSVSPMAMRADITVQLGDNVAVKGYGLDGKVHGTLAVRAQPDQDATGRGEIQVSGTYQAYGQNLQIERGRLLFAGTRLDNPGLDIRAQRAIRADNITVGLSVRGTAQQPILTVFSDPSMEQAQALSYLVTGRPLESLKSGEADTLNTAAQALGGLAGDRLAKSLGSRLGLEAGVSSSDALGGSAFTAGKYLSPRLFLSYGVGLFTPGQVITLRYTLNRFLQFEAENATTGNRASLNYRIEK